MHKTLLISLCLSSAGLLGACAHQAGDAQTADSKKTTPTNQQDRPAQAENDQGCEDMTAGRRSQAITDCDMRAVDQALAPKSAQPLSADTLSNDIQRLPTARRLGL